MFPFLVKGNSSLCVNVKPFVTNFGGVRAGRGGERTRSARAAKPPTQDRRTASSTTMTWPSSSRHFLFLSAETRNTEEKREKRLTFETAEPIALVSITSFFYQESPISSSPRVSLHHPDSPTGGIATENIYFIHWS